MSDTDTGPEWQTRLPGLAALWSRTRGHASIRVAVLDGAIDPTAAPPGFVTASGPVEHGTLVASIIAGSAALGLRGIASDCTILGFPIFEAGPSGEALLCSQDTLADAIVRAIEAGAQIINISASEQADLLSVSSRLSAALVLAGERDVLIVAAAGNGGCACDVIPASVPGVLAVGAHDPEGRPLRRSNWGPGQRDGILAPGLGLPGACLDGNLCRGTGTSFAAAVVSGVAALLMSLDVARGLVPGGRRVRQLLVETADPCPAGEVELCGPYLAGRLNVSLALERLLGAATIQPAREPDVTETDAFVEGAASSLAAGSLPAAPLVSPLGSDQGTGEASRPLGAPGLLSGLAPAHEDCGCGGKPDGGGCACGGKAKTPPQLVYAIGRLGISFPSQARRDAIWRSINGSAAAAAPRTDLDLKPITNQGLLDLFRREPWHAQSVIWTLSRTEVPMYAIAPMGAFAAETYAWLVTEWADPDAEFISLPGIVGGQMTLYDGQVVDAVVPDMRGMFSWESTRYVKALSDQMKLPKKDSDATAQRIDRFLRKIYFRIRNRGLAPEERALNAAATNAFNISDVIVQAGAEGLAFRDITVERSPLNRPGSDDYDVLLTFFDPGERMKVAPLVARFTIDVSDTVPIVVGEPVTWYEY